MREPYETKVRSGVINHSLEGDRIIVSTASSVGFIIKSHFINTQTKDLFF